MWISVTLLTRKLSRRNKGRLNPFPNDKFLDSSKLDEFADDNFELDENGREFSKRVENTVGKGEIARYEQFLLFPQCFQILVLQTRKDQGLFWKGLIATIIIRDNCVRIPLEVFSLF